MTFNEAHHNLLKLETAIGYLPRLTAEVKVKSQVLLIHSLLAAFIHIHPQKAIFKSPRDKKIESMESKCPIM